MKLWHGILLIIGICIITVSLILVGCDSDADKDESIQPQAENISQSVAPNPQNIDKSKFSNEEAAVLIFSNLNSNLPADYKGVKLNRPTLSVHYINNGKWEHHVIGAGESRKSLPEEKVVESEILWRINQKEQVTSYDVSLTGVYYENLQICEISSIEKYNIVTENRTLYSNEMKAKLKVTFVKFDYYGFQINVQNSGAIPINGIKLLVSYGANKSLNFEKSYDLPLFLDWTTTFSTIFPHDVSTFLQYQRRDDWPTYYKFFTSSGLEIPK